MPEHTNEYWEQIKLLYDQKIPIRTLDRGIVNTITDLEDSGLTIVSSLTERPRRIYRRSLERLWEASRATSGAKIKGGWDAVEAAIIGHLPNIEYATRPMRLFFVDPPTHELGTTKRSGEPQVAVPKEPTNEERNGEQAGEELSEEEGWEIGLDPIWGPFTTLKGTSESSAISDLSITEDDPVWLEVKSLVDEGYRSIIFSGPPGTSKTWYAQQTALKLIGDKHARIWTIQFHPSYSYEDFVEGRVPTSMRGDEPFPVRPKLFLLACMEAAKLDGFFVLIIDEISRGDPSRIFGEVLTYVEHRGKAFILPYSQRVAFVPENLVILGTMNPYDKSVADLDQALQRRFEYIPMRPDPNLLRKLLEEANTPADLSEAIRSFFTELQSKCPNRIGHAYFKGINSWQQVRTLWRRKLERVLEDHFYPEIDRVDEIKERFDHYFINRR